MSEIKTEVRRIRGYYMCGVCNKTIGEEVVWAIFEPWNDSWRVKYFACLVHGIEDFEK